ncbi:hypothetical protein [Geodermatophilus marinus]|uniref:hypothetical protein n=1 Tax=Geodermatophilus sp. LHW52908 TaxID=2303986 RepID=UPI000E3D1C4F|nr:hypothetical protein [Geodermatophilus sp. LHW52908]RFU18932.1 hypothetical protein D0Z06_24110 [Geodermatophilus sp. LHW52908]
MTAVAHQGVVGEHGWTDPPEPAAAGIDALFEPRPRFRRRLHGYDPADVDEYVAWAEAELAGRTAEPGWCSGCNDLAGARPGPVPPPADAVSVVTRMDELLRLAESRASALVAGAEEEAGRIRETARAEAEARLRNVVDLRAAAVAAGRQVQLESSTLRREAEAVLAAARREADAALETARQGAQAALAAARQDAEELLAAARAEAEEERAARLAAVGGELADLCRQRDEARAALRRVTGQIAAALDSLAVPGPAAPGAARAPGVRVTGNVVIGEPRQPVAP